MKQILSLLLIVAFSSTSYANHHAEKNGVELPIKTGKSEILWVGGKKFTDSTHSGTVGFKSGFITFDKDQPVKGQFVIDMTSIKNTDLPAEKQPKLVSHLSSDDFFAVDKFKTASFSFDEVKSLGNNQYALTGMMKIRDVEKKETVQATISKNADGTYAANADIVIDRTKYGVNFHDESADGSKTFFLVKLFKGAGAVAKDKIIKNDMTLTVKLVAGK
jgi:polyisoprenoid-binding protein YceI